MIGNYSTEKSLARVGLIALVLLLSAGLASTARAQQPASAPPASEATPSMFDKIARSTPLVLPAIGILAYYLLRSRLKKRASSETVLVGGDHVSGGDDGEQKAWTTDGEEKKETGYSQPKVGITRDDESEERDDSTPSFCFALEGEGARGDVVKYEADVDLIFNYAVPSPLALVEFKSERLETTVRQEERVELGITVIPIGFKFRDDVWFRTAEFRRGALVKPVKFHLTAPPAPAKNAHLFITLSLYGCMLYQFPIEVRLVEALTRKAIAKRLVTTLDLDLDEVLAEHALATRTGGARP